MEMLKAKKADGEYVIPKIIYSDAYESEMVAFADSYPARYHLSGAA